MSTKITMCPKCKSTNIVDVNPKSRETSKTYLVAIKARCSDCGEIFTYQSATEAGKRKGIKY
jgi:transposase-like protein